MNIKLIRAFSNSKATLGILQIEGVDHSPIFTLENPQRQTIADSCIPVGAYLCRPYSGTIHKDVYELQFVPRRTSILIHTGNYEYETLGCILIGLNAGEVGGNPCVLNSRIAMDYIKKLVGKQNFTLTIV